MAADIEQTTVDAQGMRARNSALLLNLIWRAREISRADLARRTGLSPSTVSAIVGDLERSGLVQSNGAGLSRGEASSRRTSDEVTPVSTSPPRRRLRP